MWPQSVLSAILEVDTVAARHIACRTLHHIGIHTEADRIVDTMVGFHTLAVGDNPLADSYTEGSTFELPSRARM